MAKRQFPDNLRTSRVCLRVGFGVDIFDLNLRIQIDSVKQPVKSNSVGSGYESHCWTSQLNNVNASTRALSWSTTLDGRRPIDNTARRGRNTILRHGPQPRAPFATCRSMRPTQLGLWLQSGETTRKKELTHCSIFLKKITWLSQLPRLHSAKRKTTPQCRTRTSWKTRITPPYSHSSLHSTRNPRDASFPITQM